MFTFSWLLYQAALCQHLQVTSSLDLQCLAWDFPESDPLNKKYQGLRAQSLFSFVWATTEMHMQLHYIFEEQVPQRSAQLGALVLPFKPHPAAVSVRGA